MTIAAAAPSPLEHRRPFTAQSAAATRGATGTSTGTSCSFVGASNRSEGAWERTFNCEDSDIDLRDFWAIVLEGTGRARLQVLCAPLVVLDAGGEPVFMLLHSAPADKNAEMASGFGTGKVGATGHVEGLHIDGGKSGTVWAAVQQHMRPWPRVAVKRRLTDAASIKGAKELSSTQVSVSVSVIASVSVGVWCGEN
jgi:hypothetical protein